VVEDSEGYSKKNSKEDRKREDPKKADPKIEKGVIT
jgi:hypothetical protein